MKLTDSEKRMLAGEVPLAGSAAAVAKAMDYLVQFGDAFGAERFVDVIYAHYPAEMSIYRGNVEDALEYAETGARVCIPTTSSTLACDPSNATTAARPRCTSFSNKSSPHTASSASWARTPARRNCSSSCRQGLVHHHGRVVGDYLLQPVLGARTNRGGLFTRYAAVTGKYPLTGYLLDENRRGTHLFKLHLERDDLRENCDFSALGFHVGGIVGSEVPVFDALPAGTTQDNLIALGAALATSGSVTLFHAPPHTTEARTVAEALHGGRPKETHTVTRADLRAVFDKLTTIAPSGPVDFVTLGCPHYSLEQLRWVADWFVSRNARVHSNVRLWVCTNRMTRRAAEWQGITQSIEAAGGRVICDTCPVESHMRISTCKEHGLPTPQIQAMVTDSCKMARYVGDLIGCKTALRDRDQCLAAAVAGRLV